MVNRRHIRIKVMQSIYAMHQSDSNVEKQEKFLFHSIDAIQDLYLIILSSLIEIVKKEKLFLKLSSKKHLATVDERNPNKKFIQNNIIQVLSDSNSLRTALAYRNINNWNHNDDYILLLLSAVKESKWYAKYMRDEVNHFEEDKQFVIDIFTEVIAPNEKLYEYFEDNKLTWVDDIPVVNTYIVKQLQAIKSIEAVDFDVPKPFKDVEDKDFARDLFRKTILNEKEFVKEFESKTPNWDIERIAEIDTIILKMAICELLNFPSIPAKVTLNEYLELAKEYSTPKSSIFINGILDNLVKEFQANKKMLKIGRGLV